MVTRSKSRLIESIGVVVVLGFGGCRLLFWNESMSDLRSAEELSRQGRYAEAIAAYEAHMRQRLQIDDRPEWENPYFYRILIGDIRLGQGDPDGALASYMEADKQRVDSFLIADRIRSVAQWYEQRGELRKAIELLRNNRHRDELLFDSMLDRYSRLMTSEEDRRPRESEDYEKGRR